MAKSVVWRKLLRGSLVALGVYLCGGALAALLILRGVLPMRSVFPVMAVLCVLSVLLGGLLAAPGSPIGTLPAALAVAACFAGVLICVGLGCWPGITWMGHGGILLLCALGGGVLAGLLAGSRKGRGKRKRKAHL